MSEKFDSFESLEKKPEGFIENGSDVESDQETLEQKVETIVLDFSPEEFKLLKETKEKFNEKTEGKPEVYKKAYQFGEKLFEKHGEDARSVALAHILIGSSGIYLDNPMIKKVDFEGEDSIVDFIEKL